MPKFLFSVGGIDDAHKQTNQVHNSSLPSILRLAKYVSFKSISAVLDLRKMAPARPRFRGYSLETLPAELTQHRLDAIQSIGVTGLVRQLHYKEDIAEHFGIFPIDIYLQLSFFDLGYGVRLACVFRP